MLEESVLRAEAGRQETGVPPQAALSPRPSPNWRRRYALAAAALDALAVALGTVAAQVLRFGEVGSRGVSRGSLSYVVIGAFVMPAWVATMAIGGAYERSCLGANSDEYRRAFDAAMRFLALVAVVAFVLRVDMVRGFVAIALPLATALTLVQRFALRKWLYRQRRRGRFTKRVLVVGSETASTELIDKLRRSPFTGLAVVGACVPGLRGQVEVGSEPVPVVGDPHRAVEAVVSAQADAIAIADTTISNGALRRLAWQLEGTGVELMVAPVLTDVAGPRISIRPVSGLPLLHVEEPELRGARRLAKAAFDRVFACAALLVLLPFLLAVALCVRLTSRGPALFRQVRVGLGGRHFVMWKFRTMAIDAEQQLVSVLHLNEHDGVLFKIRNDPRITPLGRFLRRWSIDELPQLWNVLRGEMSIVGPRPPLPSEVERYSDHVRRRLLMKPGLTGLWQVSGRAGLPWEEAVRLDLYYVENWSPSLDALIIAKTLSAVVLRRGAF